MNPEAISTLIESNRFNIDILPQLENYVQYQVEKGTYHLEANLTLLKFYQFHPEKANRFVVGSILIKALMNLPHTDFLYSSYLISEKMHSEEPIQTLNTLSNLLETAQFGAFWQESKTCKEMLDKVPGFDNAIRSFIMGVVMATYKTITKDLLSEVLNLKGGELDTYISSKGWKVDTDSVTFPRAEESTTKGKRTTENIKLQDLSKIMASLYSS